jgi:hypothetical protein
VLEDGGDVAGGAALGLDQGVELGEGERGRLLHQHGDPGLQALQCLRGVQQGRGAQVDQVHLLLAEQLGQARVGARHVPRGGEGPGSVGVDVDRGDEFGSLAGAGQGLGVCGGDPTGADDRGPVAGLRHKILQTPGKRIPQFARPITPPSRHAQTQDVPDDTRLRPGCCP